MKMDKLLWHIPKDTSEKQAQQLGGQIVKYVGASKCWHRLIWEAQDGGHRDLWMKLPLQRIRILWGGTAKNNLIIILWLVDWNKNSLWWPSIDSIFWMHILDFNLLHNTLKCIISNGSFTGNFFSKISFKKCRISWVLEQTVEITWAKILWWLWKSGVVIRRDVGPRTLHPYLE